MLDVSVGRFSVVASRRKPAATTMVTMAPMRRMIAKMNMVES